MSCTMDMHGIIFGMVLPLPLSMVDALLRCDGDDDGDSLPILLRAKKLTRVIILAGRQEKMGHSKARNPVCLQRIM